MDRGTLRRLIDACRAGQPDEVAGLIAAGADVNTTLGAGPPGDPKPLLWTLRPPKWTAGHRRVLELLLDAGADPDGGGLRGGLSPLVAAAEQGHHTAIDILLARGATVGFHEAVALGDPDRIEASLAKDPSLASAVRRCGVGIHGGAGTSLHFAALSKLDGAPLAKVAERLIEAGTPAGGFDDVPPPIERAARADNAAVAAVLLRHGADPADALARALYEDARAVLAVLDGRGLRLDLPGDPKLGNTLLDETIRWGRLESARWLIMRGVPVDRPDGRGWTALHYACSRGVAPDLVELLLVHGASPTAGDQDGHTPLDLAREGGKEKLVALLESVG